MKSDYAKTMLAAIILGALFWVVDGCFEYLFFHKNLKFLLLEGPETLMESLFTRVPLHSLFVRISFICACLVGGLLLSLFLWKRNKLRDELRQSEETFAGFFNQGNIGMAITSPENQFVQVNKKLCYMLGFERRELLQKSLMEITHPDDVEEDRAQFRKMVKGEIDNYEMEKRLMQKEDGVIYTHSNISCLRREDASVDKVLVTIQDITERKWAEEEHAKLQRQLQQAQKMESIGDLAGGIAHDFNNLLTPIIGLSELLMQDLPPESIQYRNTSGILSAGKRGRDLVKQILAFSRHSTHQKAPVRIQQILRDALKLSRSTIPSDIEIHSSIDNDCGMVLGDAIQLHQVVMNLVTNAFHAVEANRGFIVVELKQITLARHDLGSDALQPGQYAFLSVADTGCGIDAAHVDKIFDPYFTTKKKGKGTGLGLAMVFGIIKGHQGEIKVYSQLGQGANFNVYLPLMEKGPEIGKEETAAPDQTGRGERILLVDDEEPIVEYEKQMLERLGYHVTDCSGSVDALNLFQADPDGFDLVITDMTMPRMTGDQMARQMIAIRADIPIIICTGFSERISKEKAEVAGIKGFLMKPAVRSDMASMVRQVLDKTRMKHAKITPDTITR